MEMESTPLQLVLGVNVIPLSRLVNETELSFLGVLSQFRHSR
jgi:hypothetical protein